MSHGEETDSESFPSPPDVQRRRVRPSFHLLTILLLVAAIACWLSFYQLWSETQRMESELPSLRELARELVVSDPSMYAVVRHHQLWNDDFRWRIYLPPDGNYEIHLATREIAGDLPQPKVSKPIAPGEHELELRTAPDGDEVRVEVLLDGKVHLETREPDEWDDASGSVGGSKFSANRQQQPDQPLILFHRRFSFPNSGNTVRAPDGPGRGLVLWITPDGTPSGESAPRD
ncbi:hypothetical protein FYK55_23965 [Roseiconus nitratireducens]|uniref:Uncharacterized protein n=1 Tax=Roseiconus nitratireducens TaxID=2605748 RepID=A0A5M6CXG5_9BACT|nr:hypothetical protein [Roseiconus nitratireducens]KAA5539626.1 hypothetical protein FYK55_23965 [Roseiconus nitratireducens]